jgi:anti-sigma factor RsiW
MEPLVEHPRAALHAYLDGELSLEGSLAVEEHLAGCSACRQRLETFRTLRKLVRAARPEAAEAESALARVVPSAAALGAESTPGTSASAATDTGPTPVPNMPAATDAGPMPVPNMPAATELGPEPDRSTPLAPPRRARRWPPLAVAGGLAAVAAAVLAVVLPYQQMQRDTHEVAEVHARAQASGRWVETSSDDPGAVARWLEPRVQYPLPTFPTGEGFALRGARVEALQGAQVATAVYEVRRHVVDVFAWPSREGDSEPVPTVTGPWTVCRWAHGGVAYWMVSDAGSDDLKRLAGFLKAQRS